MPPARSPVPPCNLLPSIKRKGRKGNRSAMGNSFQIRHRLTSLLLFCFCRLVAWIHVLLSFTVSAESMIHSSLSRYLSLSVVVLLRSKGMIQKCHHFSYHPFLLPPASRPPSKQDKGQRLAPMRSNGQATHFSTKKNRTLPPALSRVHVANAWIRPSFCKLRVFSFITYAYIDTKLFYIPLTNVIQILHNVLQKCHICFIPAYSLTAPRSECSNNQSNPSIKPSPHFADTPWMCQTCSCGSSSNPNISFTSATVIAYRESCLLANTSNGSKVRSSTTSRSTVDSRSAASSIDKWLWSAESTTKMIP